MSDTVRITEGRVRRSAPGLAPAGPGARIEQPDGAFVLSRVLPDRDPVYYRVGRGRLEWSGALGDFLPENGRADLDPGALLSRVQGSPPAPGSTPVPGVQRLEPGDSVRIDTAGVRVTRRREPVPAAESSLPDAVSRALGGDGRPYAIAYSGGLSSAFLAVCALAAGDRPPLLHADFGPFASGPGPADIPGLRVERVPVDPFELVDPNQVTGAEPVPPMPELAVPRLLAARLAAAHPLPLASGALLEALLASRLPDADAGVRGRRLLGCEPFHISGTLRSLAEARARIGEGVVHVPGAPAGADAPDTQQVGAPPPPSPTGGPRLPGLTDTGRQALESSWRGSMALWRAHLDDAEPIVGRATAALAERGDGGAALPALAPGVLAAAAAFAPSALGRIRHGVFRTHLPMRRALDARGVTGLRHAAPGFWLRFAAAAYLHRERGKVVAELERECALADLGLVDAAALTRILRDGAELAPNALVLLRLLWLERWMRG